MKVSDFSPFPIPFPLRLLAPQIHVKVKLVYNPLHYGF